MNPGLFKRKAWDPGTQLIFENFIKSQKPNERRVGKKGQVVGEFSLSLPSGDINQVINHTKFLAKVSLFPGN